MSEENVETIRRVYEGVTARLEVPRSCSIRTMSSTTRSSGRISSKSWDLSAQEAMREYWETFEAYHVEIDEVIYADEGRVVDVVRDGGRMRGTDAEVWNRFFHVWTFADGRIVRLSIHTDRNRALEAAGLSGSGASDRRRFGHRLRDRGRFLGHLPCPGGAAGRRSSAPSAPITAKAAATRNAAL